MKHKPTTHSAVMESLNGIVDRVTYHNPDNGWSVLRVLPFGSPHQQETVIVHQTRVFAGATMTFYGAWTHHPKYGRQFKADKAVEKKPADTAALEKYLGSGLIKSVGPKTAKKIVAFFGDETLNVFEHDIQRLMEVPGIAHKKLTVIREAWMEHRAVRNVMMFLQTHGISTLYAVRIYQEYGDRAVDYVNENPYRLAQDFYGIGFFSADKVALSIGLQKNSRRRIEAGINHVLASAREFGHCFLTKSQITARTNELLELNLDDRITDFLSHMRKEGLLMVRDQVFINGKIETCYYSRSLYFDERYVARRIAGIKDPPQVDEKRVDDWIRKYGETKGIRLSPEQAAAVKGIACRPFSVLTGGPGCGKTTAIRALVKLLEAMNMKILPAAPTGRAAQRMTDVIGKESKTIHRLLEWRFGRFKRNEQNPLDVDFMIIDECSMLDINLTASLLRAIPQGTQILFVGDEDQLPSVGAGNVLGDIIASGKVGCFKLTHVFRQARTSLIIRFAHQINNGRMPRIDSPFHRPEIWRHRTDCLFIDSDEATKEQLNFIAKIKRLYPLIQSDRTEPEASDGGLYRFGIDEPFVPYEKELIIPKKFEHVDLEQVYQAKDRTDELWAVLKKVHPWSSLHYGLSALEVIRKLYVEWIPKYFGEHTEIQVLSPMTRGSLGTVGLNKMIQEAVNPDAEGKSRLTVGDRVFKVGDRVIHRRNNYELNVFNGDIGVIKHINPEVPALKVSFFPNHRVVVYTQEAVSELDLAYAVTVHKSQGSEFEAVILPVFTQHFKMLFRNLIYTGLTRAKRLAVLVGTRKAMAMAVKNKDTATRQTLLKDLLRQE